MSNSSSQRLSYRRLRLSDAAFLLELVNSPGWIENIGDRNVHSVADAEQYLTERIFPSYDKEWTGPYGMTLEDRLIGTIGIYARPGLDVPDLGFALLPAYYRQGFATEASRWAIELAKAAGVKQLSAIYLPSNQASHGLLLNLGFVPEKRIKLPKDEEELQYATLCL